MAKKQRFEASLELKRKPHASKIFSSFRTLGVVSTNVPFSVTTLGQSFVVSTVVGRSFQMYDAGKLHLLFLSHPQTSENINCIHSHFQHVFAAWGRKIGIFYRGKLVAEHDVPDQVKKLLTFGEYLCASNEKEIYVFKWTGSTREPIASLTFYTTLKVPSIYGELVDLCHLATYVNKLVVATSTNLILYNVKTGKQLYVFDEITAGIAFIEPAPVALDVVAVACRNGDIRMTNIRSGRTIFTIQVGEPVSSLSFRSDGVPLLGVGGTNADMFFYNLNTQRRILTVRNVHTGRIVKLQFFSGQPLLLSIGSDNRLVEFVFDAPVTNDESVIPPPRILRQRGGHSRPPSNLCFTDPESHYLLSASLDQTLWAFSLRKDSQTHELSQRISGRARKRSLMSQASKPNEKFPPIIDIAYQGVKQERWDNILTAHKGELFARSWSGRRGIVGDHKLFTPDNAVCKTVAISSCGNFGMVGSASGGIAVYNMQSGILRKRLLVHKLAVTGLRLNPINTVLISASLEGFVRFHDFQTLQEIGSVDLGSAITMIRFHDGVGLIAVVCDDMAIYMVDSSTRKVVRELWGHGNRITSLDFTPDGRWIMSSSLDCTIRTWDIPTGCCIDGVRVPSAVTCLRVSPNGEWLATAHVEGVGVQLWTMRSQFYNVSLRQISDDEIRAIEMPNSTGENGVGILDGALEKEDNVETGAGDLQNAPEMLASKLASLSVQPRSKFTTLVNLDTIRQRNKPLQPPTKPKKAPFFLDAADNVAGTTNESLDTQILAPTDAKSESRFSHLLNVGDLDGIVEYLASLGPAATDLEIQLMEEENEFVALIDAISHQLNKLQNLDLCEAWMFMLQKAHVDIFFEPSPAIKDCLERWASAQDKSIKEVQENFRYCNGVLAYLRQV